MACTPDNPCPCFLAGRTITAEQAEWAFREAGKSASQFSVPWFEVFARKLSASPASDTGIPNEDRFSYETRSWQ